MHTFRKAHMSVSLISVIIAGVLLLPCIDCWIAKINPRYSRAFRFPTCLHSGLVDGISNDCKKVTMEHLNSKSSESLLLAMISMDEKLKEESQRANFWSSGNFVIQEPQCIAVDEQGLRVKTTILIKGKANSREVFLPFPNPVSDEFSLKTTLVRMATAAERLQDTAALIKLPFGQDVNMPKDFRFNDVPHSQWLRNYVYESVTDAVIKAVEDPFIKNKSRLQIKVNVPEVNPAFDTYRIGTLLEMVRNCVLALVDQKGMRVRICVQQSLGEGVFSGLPLALASMKPVLERMDWGPTLQPEQKFKMSDYQTPRSEAFIRLGSIGKDQVAPDDDVFFIIAPQNGK